MLGVRGYPLSHVFFLARWLLLRVVVYPSWIFSEGFILFLWHWLLCWWCPQLVVCSHLVSSFVVDVFPHEEFTLFPLWWVLMMALKVVLRRGFSSPFWDLKLVLQDGFLFFQMA